MGIAEVLKMKKSVKTKLMAAISMLLVSAILLSTSTYAWFVLSTAPEVKEIRTTAGANGYLEIALAGTAEEDGRIVPGEPNTMIEGKSISLRYVQSNEANTYWGNLVDITNSYGLENMTIYPSRLNLSGIDNTVAVDAPLLAPKFGTDGRISGMNGVQKASFNLTEGSYTLQTSYGVHLLGFFGEGEEPEEYDDIKRVSRQWLIDWAKEQLDTYQQQLREDTIDVLKNHEYDIIRMMLELKFAYDSGTGGTFALLGITSLSDDSKASIVEIVDELDAISVNALDCLRYAVMARMAADTTYFPNDDTGNRALATIYVKFSELSTRTIEDYATAYGYQEILDTVAAINSVRSELGYAKEQADDSPSQAATHLFSMNDTSFGTSSGSMSGFSILSGLGVFRPSPIQNMIMDSTHTAEMRTWISNANAVFPSMAAIIGDYHPVLKANMDYSEFKNDARYADTETTYNVNGGDYTYAQLWDGMVMQTFAGNYTINMYNTSGSSGDAYDDENNIGGLRETYEQVKNAEVGGELEIINRVSESKTAYGYSVDMAFRSNEGGNLLLRQTGVDRTTGLTQDAADLAGTYVEDMMGGGSTMSFTFGADVADPATLLAGLYVVFMDTKEGTIYAVATVDPERVVVTGNKASGPLALYSPSISNGVLTKGGPITTIHGLEPNQTLFVTALVYLNGDIVNGAMVSATGSTSLQGSLNLQFGSSAELTPMTYTDYLPAAY